MMKRIIFFILFFLTTAFAQDFSLSSSEIQQIGQQIFKNECSGNEECLLEWNEGEDFMSLGIGHFIWYPEGEKGPFEESFIEFLGYVQKAGGSLPAWLDINPFPQCPWKTKEEFLKDRQSERALELRQFLSEIKTKQAEFIVKHLDDALPLMLQNMPEEMQPKIAENFLDVASTPAGIYALVDYINFKGLGIIPTERYQGKGWGLTQVLLEMNGSEETKPLEDFVKAANKILKERVQNSPPERNEQRWLAGWQNRVMSYLD